ncbi:MAG: hypothetical protein HKM93_20195 [Desulfobacteraceae bacterium]|nr:hypothetical protein [Desulfobacteraceae bacterium]
MKHSWSYNSYDIKDGLKPGSTEFRYFFMVSKGDEKKCRYCVWITPEAVSRFDAAKDFEAIVSSRKEDWVKWVKEKIDAGDFRDRALKFDTSGETEINLADAGGHVTMDSP